MEFSYTITKQLLQTLMRISTLEEQLKRLDLPASLRTTLNREVKIKTSHYSNKIEGNSLTLAQTHEVWKRKSVKAPKRDIQEVKNLFDLFDHLIKSAHRPQPLTKKHILDIHRFVERNIVKGRLLGHYREAQNAIFDGTTGEIVYLPPEASDVPELMHRFIALLNNQEWEHPLIKAAIAHFGLVTLHPFMDGNGRTARALSTLILMNAGYQFVRLIAWDEYFYHHRNQYYNILHETQGHNFYDRNKQWDTQAWLNFFILGVEQTITIFLEKITEETPPPKLNRRQEKALRFLKRHGIITNREYRQLNKVSNFTALADLRSLEEMGVLTSSGRGRSVTYTLTK